MPQILTPWTGRLDTTRVPYRVWMTGSIAVIMAAIWALRGLPDEERAKRLLRHSSPYSVSETVLRIEAAAAERGLHVLLREAVGTSPVIVLASSAGGTPVLMAGADRVPAMPMSLQVRSLGGSRSEVLVPDASRLMARVTAELPSAVAAELAALPTMLDHALTG
jgi:uncharacterized protein (DUF302 family)